MNNLETVNTTAQDYAKLKGVSLPTARRLLSEIYISKQLTKVKLKGRAFNMSKTKKITIWTIPAEALQEAS